MARRRNPTMTELVAQYEQTGVLPPELGAAAPVQTSARPSRRGRSVRRRGKVKVPTIGKWKRTPKERGLKQGHQWTPPEAWRPASGAFYVWPAPNRTNQGATRFFYVTDGSQVLSTQHRTKAEAVKALKAILSGAEAQLRVNPPNPLTREEQLAVTAGAIGEDRIADDPSYPEVSRQRSGAAAGAFREVVDRYHARKGYTGRRPPFPVSGYAEFLPEAEREIDRQWWSEEGRRRMRRNPAVVEGAASATTDVYGENPLTHAEAELEMQGGAREITAARRLPQGPARAFGRGRGVGRLGAVTRHAVEPADRMAARAMLDADARYRDNPATNGDARYAGRMTKAHADAIWKVCSILESSALDEAAEPALAQVRAAKRMKGMPQQAKYELTDAEEMLSNLLAGGGTGGEAGDICDLLSGTLSDYGHYGANPLTPAETDELRARGELWRESADTWQEPMHSYYEGRGDEALESARRYGTRGNPDAAGMPTSVVPYFTDYGSEAEVIDAWYGGKDFLIQDIASRWDGKPMSIRDVPEGWHGVIQVRYNRLGKVFYYTGQPKPKVRGKRRKNPARQRTPFDFDAPPAPKKAKRKKKLSAAQQKALKKMQAGLRKWQKAQGIKPKRKKAAKAAPTRAKRKKAAPTRAKRKAVRKTVRRPNPRADVCTFTVPLEKGKRGARCTIVHPRGLFKGQAEALRNIQRELRAKFKQLKQAPAITRCEWRYSDAGRTKGRWHFTAKRGA